VAIGEPDAVAARLLRAHLDAGADHVAVQLLVAPDGDLLEGCRTPAPALDSVDRRPDRRWAGGTTPPRRRAREPTESWSGPVVGRPVIAARGARRAPPPLP
jgi:hypothetical protein